MIDCMLILLIFFMVATTMKHMDKELPIELPASSAAIPKAAEESLIVLAVDERGNKYLGTTPISREDLIRTLDKAGRQSEKPRVRIDADRNARYEAVVELIELCQFNSLREIGFHTRSEKPSP